MDDDKLVVIRLGKAISLAHAGQPTKAVAEANDVARSAEANAFNLYEFARVHAIAALAAKKDADLREHYSTQAIELLHHARAKGFKDIENLKKDADFGSLRSRDDFKRLMEEFEKQP
jgi:hypothetical protein